MLKHSQFRILLFPLICALSAVVCGCGESQPLLVSDTVAEDALINTICPIMGGEATEDVSVDWNGKKVGFCCPPCIEEWAELTEQEKVDKLASAKSKPHGDHDHAEHDHGDHTATPSGNQSAP